MTSQNKLKFQNKNGIILIELFYLSAYNMSFRIKIFMFFLFSYEVINCPRKTSVYGGPS